MPFDVHETESRCVERVCCGLSPEIARGTICMMLQSFLDDTVSGDGSRYIIVGYVTSLDNWNEFSPARYAALKEPPKHGYYRTTEALSLSPTSQFQHSMSQLETRDSKH